MSEVVIREAQRNSKGIHKSLNDVLENLEFNFYKKKFIAIKLNLCLLRYPETASTTDPLFLEQLLKLIREQNRRARILLLESDATTTLADLLFNYLGFKKLAKKYKAECFNISNASLVKKRIRGLYFKEVMYPRILKKCDCLISHPKLKTHTLTLITCGMKNMFGCLPKKRKASYHKMIDEVIVDCCRLFKPDLTITDGILAMTGRGPINGFPTYFNNIIASRDVLANDVACAKILGFNPRKVKHLRLARGVVGSFKFRVNGRLIKKCDLGGFDKSYYYLNKLRKVIA